MVERLLLFRHAVRSQDWLLHLKSTEDIIGDVISMDRIKYRRMLPVYLADMKHLESEEPTIWNSFLQGNFAVKKSDISFTSLGIDHAGEQQNKLLEIQGGIVGITKNEHARIRYFLTASILANISSELKNIISTNSYTSHHRLNKNAAISKQAKMMNSLRKTLDERRFSLESTEENTMFNIITNVVQPEEIYNDVMSVPNRGKQIFEQFFKERLQSTSTIGIWEPVKRLNLKLFTWGNEKKKQKTDQKIEDYKESCGMFARCALAASCSDVDMENIVGEYELSIVPRSLMSSNVICYIMGEMASQH